MKKYFLPPACFNDLQVYAQENQLDILHAIVGRHVGGEIELEKWEVEMLLDAARVWRLEAKLRYPFWSFDHPKYDLVHEDAFFNEQYEKWSKIAMTLVSIA